jgi:hypothetical protein
MVTPSSRPGRSWRLWATVAVFTATAFATAYHRREHRRTENEWLAHLQSGGLQATFSSSVGIDFADRFGPLKDLFGQHHVTVEIMNDGDGEYVLGIPACPMPISVVTSGRVSSEMNTRLSDRYGTGRVERSRRPVQ